MYWMNWVANRYGMLAGCLKAIIELLNYYFLMALIQIISIQMVSHPYHSLKKGKFKN